MVKIDNTDRKILRALARDARVTNAELAQRVNLSPTPCLRRLRRLEAEGPIRGYEARFDLEALGLAVAALAFVKLTRASAENAAVFEREVAALPAVVECNVVAGSYDYVLRIVARSLGDYEMILKNHLAGISTVGDVESTIILKQVPCDPAPPI